MWDKTDRAITFLPSLNDCDGREWGSSRGADGEVKAALGYLFIAHFNKMGWNQPCLALYPRFNCGKTNECSFTWEETHHRWKNLLRDNGTVKRKKKKKTKKKLGVHYFCCCFFFFFFFLPLWKIVLWCSQIARVNTTMLQRSLERETLHYLQPCSVPRSGLKNNLCHSPDGIRGPKWLQCEAQLSERGDMQRQCGITVNCSPQPPHGCTSGTAPRRWCRGAWSQWTPAGVVTRTSTLFQKY